MENGDNLESGRFSPKKDMLSSPLSDHIPCFSEISHQFIMERTQKMSTKAVVKVVEDLNYQICKYHALAVSLGTTLDGELLRKELAQMQQKSCDTVSSARIQLSDAFRRAGSFPKKEIAELEQSCRVLVACIHMLDRELRRTMHLYHLFPLIPDADEAGECCFISTGLSSKQDVSNNNALVMLDYGQAEKYFRERDSWQELEKEILELHSLDVALHRDEILGPVMDYLTLCPMGLDNISCSTTSADDVCSPSDGCVDDNMSRKKSNILCYVVAIMTFACVGGGVLMGVIFMIVY